MIETGEFPKSAALILKLTDWPMLTLNGSAKPSMLLLALVMSQVDCGVPCCWFSHATGLPHEEESCSAAEDADAAGAYTARAPAAIRAMAAIRPRNRLERTIAIRAIGLLDFAHATALLTIPPLHPAGKCIDAAVPY